MSGADYSQGMAVPRRNSAPRDDCVLQRARLGQETVLVDLQAQLCRSTAKPAARGCCVLLLPPHKSLLLPPTLQGDLRVGSQLGRKTGVLGLQQYLQASVGFQGSSPPGKNPRNCPSLLINVVQEPV